MPISEKKTMTTTHQKTNWKDSQAVETAVPKGRSSRPGMTAINDVNSSNLAFFPARLQWSHSTYVTQKQQFWSQVWMDKPCFPSTHLPSTYHVPTFKGPRLRGGRGSGRLPRGFVGGGYRRSRWGQGNFGYLWDLPGPTGSPNNQPFQHGCFQK